MIWNRLQGRTSMQKVNNYTECTTLNNPLFIFDSLPGENFSKISKNQNFRKIFEIDFERKNLNFQKVELKSDDTMSNRDEELAMDENKNFLGEKSKESSPSNVGTWAEWDKVCLFTLKRELREHPKYYDESVPQSCE